MFSPPGGVVFAARRSDDSAVVQDLHTIVFDVVTTNQGDAYNRTSGECKNTHTLHFR